MSFSQRSAVLAFLIACSHASLFGFRNLDDGVTLAYFLPDHITRHEPVILDTLIENQSGQPVAVDLGWHWLEHFRWTLKKPNGETVDGRDPHAQDPDSISPLGVVSIAPAAQHAQWMVLNEVFDFDAVGQYELTIQFDGAIRAPAGVDVHPKRVQTFHVTVQPRDEGALRSTCANLAAMATQSLNADRYYRAATALAWTVDPVAVPFLRDVALRNRAPDVVVEGLGRIDNEEAGRVLEALAVIPALPDVSEAARRELLNLARRR